HSNSAKSPDDSIVPYQVRHVLPGLIYDRLAAVRAYDVALEEETSDLLMLHALRVEFKRLRYTVALFEDVLGSQIDDFVKELKTIEDHLGRINDIHVQQEHLQSLLDDLDEQHAGIIQPHLDQLAQEQQTLVEEFPTVWRRFNTKTVQRKLANAVASL